MARNDKPEDQPKGDGDQNANDDTFGLPEIEYQPINRSAAAQESSPEAEPPRERDPEPEYTSQQPVTNTPMDRDEGRSNEYTNTYYDDDEGGSPWPKILGITALILVIAAAGWYFGYYKPNQSAAARQRAQEEEQARVEAKKIEDERAAERARLEEANQRRADSLAAASPAAGSIETLNERTGRYYVVVASSIDGDLIMDYAKELSAKGVNPKIIPPYGNVKFHRLTVAEGDTYQSTQQTADALKSEYTSDAWVIRY